MTYHEIREVIETCPKSGRDWAIYKFISLASKPTEMLEMGGYDEDFDNSKREWFEYVKAFNKNGDKIRILPNDTQLCVTLYGAVRLNTKEQLRNAWKRIDEIYQEVKQKGTLLKTSPLLTTIVEC